MAGKDKEQLMLGRLFLDSVYGSRYSVISSVYGNVTPQEVVGNGCGNNRFTETLCRIATLLRLRSLVPRSITYADRCDSNPLFICFTHLQFKVQLTAQCAME